jgi:hypothetical protein
LGGNGIHFDDLGYLTVLVATLPYHLCRYSLMSLFFSWGVPGSWLKSKVKI